MAASLPASNPDVTPSPQMFHHPAARAVTDRLTSLFPYGGRLVSHFGRQPEAGETSHGERIADAGVLLRDERAPRRDPLPGQGEHVDHRGHVPALLGVEDV